MTWCASLSAPEALAKDIADRLGEDAILADRPVDFHEEGPGRFRVTVYFEEAPDRQALGALRALAGKAGPGFTVTELPETDWVAESLAGLKPVRAGRFVVHGRHDRAQVKANDIGIEIEAGQAFGTGHHATTAGCLIAIDNRLKQGRVRRALDLGTGSGVLAIAIAKRGHAKVLASDIDPVAVRIARENVRLNGAREVRTLAAAGVAGRAFQKHGPYDLIVANILAGPLVALAPAVARLAAPGATVILSGLLSTQARRVGAAWRGQGLPLVRAETIDGWTTLTLRRP